MKRTLQYMWSAPWGAVGLVSLALFYIVGWAHGRQGLTVRTKGPLARLMARRGWAAITIGWCVFYWVPPTRATVIHEGEHVEQALRWGPLFPVAYLAASLCCGYRGNPFERAAEAKARDRLYGDLS